MANPPVALYVGSQRPNPCAISLHGIFVGANDIPRRAIAAVDVEAVAIALELILLLAKELLVRSQVGA